MRASDETKVLPADSLPANTTQPLAAGPRSKPQVALPVVDALPLEAAPSGGDAFDAISAEEGDALQTSPSGATAARAAFFRTALAYWRGDTRQLAWLYVLAIVVVMAATLGVNLAYNYWNKIFFDAVGQKQPALVWSSLLWLPVITIVGAVLAAVMVYLRMSLQAGWRKYLATRMLTLWLSDQRYYRLAMGHPDLSNVEQRIAEDVRLSTEPIVDLATGFAWSVSSALAFIGVLVWVGGSLAIGGVTIPAYLAFAAFIYAAIVSGGALWVGRHLHRVIGSKNEAEAQFRYEMTRVRENAESIAFIKGDARERAAILDQGKSVQSSWIAIAREQARLTLVLNANSFFAPTVPALLAAPKYFSGEMTLGSLMQVIAAFGAVLGALNWIADNYVRLSEVRASVDRASQLHCALVDLDGASGRASVAPGADLELRNVTLRTGTGTKLISAANVLIMPGERVLIEGKSGSGKSSLLRLMAGLWPWADGSIRVPAGASMAFVPQRPYVPIGTLRDALTYPTHTDLSDDAARHALALADLESFADRLDTVADWEQVMSGGERQRLAFARLFLSKPDLIVMDEATSALDDDTQRTLFSNLVRELPKATILSVAHRKGLEAFHDRKIALDKGQTRSVAVGRDQADPLRRLIAVIRRTRNKSL